MRVVIEMDLDVSGMNEDAVHDYIADLTYDMRVSRILNSWQCFYNPLEDKP